MQMLIAPARITLLQQGSKLGHQVTAKGLKMENVCWVKNINNFYVNFDRTCQDHIFAARIQVGPPSDSQRNGNGKCLIGGKHNVEFDGAPSGFHCCHRGPVWAPILNPLLEGVIRNWENYKRVYRIQTSDFRDFWQYLYARRDVSFQQQSVCFEEELCMIWRRPCHNISFRQITPSNQ